MKASSVCFAGALRVWCAASATTTARPPRTLTSSSQSVLSSSNLTCSSGSAITTARRGFSQQVSEWVSKLAYGSEQAPFFGSRGNAFSVEALATRQLYCKALVYASGGSRAARDWIAGSTALSSPNQALLHIALQYTATEADIWQLRSSLLETIVEREEDLEASAATAATDVVRDAETHAAPSDDETLSAEMFLLRQAPEVRCFLFDAMTACLFNAHTNTDHVERSRERIFSIGQRVFGVPRESLVSLWRVAQADLVIRKDKQRAFGQTRVE